jgi:GR25 family glycosyltransferase involved in LPS biosynthesis
VNLEEIIDAVYVINLPESKDRWIKFQKSFQNFAHPNLIKFEAINGNDLDIKSWPGNKGALGCRQSHINLLKEAKKNKFNYFIVFEDDVFIPKNFRKKLIELLSNLNDDWDMVYLFAENHFLKPDKITDKIIKLNNTLGMVGILYNRKCIDTVLEKIENDLRWIDSSIADLHQTLHVYAPSKSIVKHNDGFSTIEQKKVNYKKGILNFFIQKIYNLKNKLKKRIGYH